MPIIAATTLSQRVVDVFGTGRNLVPFLGTLAVLRLGLASLGL